MIALALALALADPAPAAAAAVAPAPLAPEKSASPAPKESAAVEGRIPVVVLDMRADGVDPALAATVTGLVAGELHDSGVMQPTTEEDIRRIMDLEQMKLMLACSDSAPGKPPEAQCLSSFKQALGAKLLVTGNVGKAGDDVILALTLIDLDKAVSIGRETAQTKSAAGLVNAVRGALPKLIKPVLTARAGSLAVLSNEEGATVLVDGAAVGTAPWRGEHLAAGPHRISATKDGFIESTVDVVIPPGGSGAIQVLLVPSAEFADAHKRTALIYRVSAFSAAGLAALSLGGGTALWVYEAGRTSEYAKTAAIDHTGAILLPGSKFEEINTLRTWGYVLLLAPVPLGVLSGTLFYIGDDPSKYDALFPSKE